MVTAARNIRTTLEMIKIEHTLFALPFAFLGAALAARGIPTLWQVVWITLAMVGARSTAMAFNRLIDRTYDAANPRTQMRAIPSGALSTSFVWMFTIVSTALFFVAAAMLNRLTLLLAPVALASILFYSYTKRFTSLSHVVLGWCLAIAPAGAWIAVRGALDGPVPLLLSLVVLLWTAGFDVLYACQDYAFDREHGLRSIPVRFGIERSLLISRGMHVATILCMAALALVIPLGPIYLTGVALVAALLTYEQSLVSSTDLSQVKRAFDMNGYVGILYFLTTAAAVFAR